MGNWKRRMTALFAVCLTAVILGGRSASQAAPFGKNGGKEYGKAETMVFVTTERLRYEELYSEKIWTAAVDNRGTTFETVLLEQIHNFLKELRVMSLMAEEENVSLTSREKELLKAAADRYFAELGEKNAGTLGLDKRTVEELYRDYWTAGKLVEKLTDGMNLEVSDSEAKVVTVSQIELADMETAEKVLALVSAEGSDFTSAAKEYSKDPEIKKQIFKGLRGTEYEKAAYSLSTGEISGIVEDSGMYYILKCVNDYDESATRIHKEQMVRQKKNEAFYNSYEAYANQVELSGDAELWKGLSIADAPDVKADFFAVFEEVCAGEEQK